MAVAQSAQLCFFGGIAFSFLGTGVLPVATQRFVQANKMGILGGLFMLKMVGDNLIQTGAFEVYVDEVRVFSKLETGQAPYVQWILRLVASASQNNAVKSASA